MGQPMDIDFFFQVGRYWGAWQLPMLTSGTMLGILKVSQAGPDSCLGMATPQGVPRGGYTTTEAQRRRPGWGSEGSSANDVQKCSR